MAKENTDSEQYEGRIRTDRKQFTMGSFGGQRFEVILETDFGKISLSCLVTQKIDASLN